MALNFRTLDLNLLRVFDATMAEGSVTRAAARLSMTQPAVSHALRRFKEAVGDELFTRTAAGVTPTPKAEALWRPVRESLDALRQTLAPGAFEPALDAVNFRLAMADATAALLCAQLIRTIEAANAKANLRVLPLTTRDPRRLLDAGEIDMAVGYFPEAVTAVVALGDDTHLRHQRLYDTRYMCVMRRGHPLAEAPLTMDAYCAAHHLLVSFSGRPHGYIDQALAAHGRQRRVVLTVNQFFTAGRVVAGSDLLTVLPERFVEATGCHRELVVRELPMPMAPVHVEMLWHIRHDSDAAHRWLRDAVAAAAVEPPMPP